MANEYEFGGTNGVAVQDFGQKNGALWMAGEANWVIRKSDPPADGAKIQHALTQQSVAFVDDLGYRGQFIVYAGRLRVDNEGRLLTIQSRLSGVRFGQTIAAGVRSAVNPALMAPTQLRSPAGTIIHTKVVVWRYHFGEARRVSYSAFTIILPMTVIFRNLG
jgi:hypothetical protein